MDDKKIGIKIWGMIRSLFFPTADTTTNKNLCTNKDTHAKTHSTAPTHTQARARKSLLPLSCLSQSRSLSGVSLSTFSATGDIANYRRTPLLVLSLSLFLNQPAVRQHSL